MTKSEIDIKIVNSPFQPNLEIAGDLVVKLHVPYSEKNVTVQINPNTVEYKEAPAKNMRQFSVSTNTSETRTLGFDFFKNKVKRLELNGKNYEIELIDIGKVKLEGQNFPTFQFKVKEL